MPPGGTHSTPTLAEDCCQIHFLSFPRPFAAWVRHVIWVEKELRGVGVGGCQGAFKNLPS